MADTADAPDVPDTVELFVGDLALDVNDARLHAAFARFPSLHEARVIWDPVTGRGRGYGFVSFTNANDAEVALRAMNGQWIGQRVVRVNRANRRHHPPTAAAATHGAHGEATPQYPLPGTMEVTPVTPLDELDAKMVQEVLSRAPLPNHRIVYLGNLPFHVQEVHLLEALRLVGIAVPEVRVHADHGYAFVRLADADAAARLILALNGHDVLGRVVKCAWGKEKAFDSPTAAPIGVAAPRPRTHPSLSHQGMHLVMPTAIQQQPMAISPSSMAPYHLPAFPGTPPAFLMSPSHYPAFSPGGMMLTPMGPFTPPGSSAPMTSNGNGGYFDLVMPAKSESTSANGARPETPNQHQHAAAAAAASMAAMAPYNFFYGFPQPAPNQVSPGGMYPTASQMGYYMYGNAMTNLPPPITETADASKHGAVEDA